MKKRFLPCGRALAAGLLLSLALAGCGGDDAPATPPGTGNPGQPGEPGEPGNPGEPNPNLRCAP